jgi:cytoskeletal protein CcmA (bactofilin family)
MNTYPFKALRCWAVLLVCCLLLTAARAQDATPPATSDEGKTTTFDSASSSSDNDDGHADEDDWAEHHHKKHVHNRNHSDDVVSIGRDAELAAGAHAHGVVAILGSATSAGDVDQDVVSVLGRTRVTGGTVGHQAVAVMGSVYINGDVSGEVVAVMGNVELGPEAKVHGNITIVGGDLKKDPAAVVEGQVQNVFGVDWANFDWVRPWIQRCLLYGRPLAFSSGLGWAWGIALGLLALYVFIASVFRGAVDKCIHTLETEPGPSILAALVLTLGVPVLFVLLAITVVGIAAIPFLAIGLVCATMFGKIVVLAAIGKRCTPTLANDPATHTVVGVIVGGLILLVVYTLPVIGFVIYKLTDLLGLGVVSYTLLISMRAQRMARTGGGGPGGAGFGGMPGVGGGPSAGQADGAPRGGGSTGLGGGLGAGAHGTGTAQPDTGAAGFTSAHSTGPNAAAGSAFGDFAAGDRQAPPGAGTAQHEAGTAGYTSAHGGGPDVAAGSAFGDFTADDRKAAPGASASGGGPPPYTTSGAAGLGASGQAPLNTSALPRAGFGIRMGALLLDIILIGIVTQQLHDHDVFLVLLAAYGAVMWKLKGSTIGGIICGLQVVRVDGRPIDWPTAVVRALSCFLSLAVVGLGFIWIAIDHDRQGWHDKIAGTAVVRSPKGASLL